MPEHSRRLPHIYHPEAPLFVTFCLHAALPRSFSIRPGQLTSGQAFVAMDRHLDSARTGPMYLGQPPIAQLILNSLARGVALSHYDLHAYVVMPNHVHILIDPKIDPSHLMRSLKGSTAREANLLLNRTGEPFWQKESYDRWVRNREEFAKIQAYIEDNPVKAGLVTAPQLYSWSSASGEMSLAAARTSACATALTPGL